MDNALLTIWAPSSGSHSRQGPDDDAGKTFAVGGGRPQGTANASRRLDGDLGRTCRGAARFSGDTGFESEELVAYELGYRRRWTASLLMDFAAFYNAYDKLATSTLLPNEVVLVPPHVVAPFISTNLTSGETFGAELVVNWRADDTLNFSAAYSILEIQLHGPPASQSTAAEAAEDQSPQQQFNLRAQWDVSDRIALDTTLYYVDELPGYAIPSYWRFDARVGWRIGDDVEIEIVGQNLCDDAHREFSGVTDVTATEIQRAVYGRLTWRS
jgi:iron complex outermembrane recepter protein